MSETFSGLFSTARNYPEKNVSEDRSWGIAGGIGGLVVGLVEVLVLVLFASGMFFDAQELADQLIAYLETARTGKSPIFAWAHFFDPHEPYDETCTRFGPTDEDRYNCEIWRVDQAIGRVLAYLDDAFPNALLTVFADHGGQFHGTSLYDEQVRVPLQPWPASGIAGRPNPLLHDSRESGSRSERQPSSRPWQRSATGEQPPILPRSSASTIHQKEPSRRLPESPGRARTALT